LHITGIIRDTDTLLLEDTKRVASSKGDNKAAISLRISTSAAENGEGALWQDIKARDTNSLVLKIRLIIAKALFQRVGISCSRVQGFSPCAS